MTTPIRDFLPQQSFARAAVGLVNGIVALQAMRIGQNKTRHTPNIVSRLQYALPRLVSDGLPIPEYV
ncbi:MAG: hypothetical protein ACI8W7_000375 [Gammaproteobacteria bacterium]|jgi:hypothetical protein